MPFFSIIIPLYNCQDTIAKCIESIISQSFSDFEIVVIDDGSEDLSFSVCQKYEQDERLRLYRKTNGGVSSARNLGVIKSVGEYVIFVDSDDCLCEEALKQLSEFIKRSDPDVVISGARIIERDRDYFEIPKNYSTDRYFNGYEALQKALKYRLMSGVVWGKTFKASFILENNLTFDENLVGMEDNKFMFQVYKNTNKICFNNILIYQYNTRDNSLSTNKNDEKKLIRYKNCVYVTEFIDDSKSECGPKERYWFKCYANRILVSTALNNGFKLNWTFSRFNSFVLYSATVRDMLKNTVFLCFPKICFRLKGFGNRFYGEIL